MLILSGSTVVQGIPGKGVPTRINWGTPYQEVGYIQSPWKD
jgi:hypothetical protein